MPYLPENRRAAERARLKRGLCRISGCRGRLRTSTRLCDRHMALQRKYRAAWEKKQSRK